MSVHTKTVAVSNRFSFVQRDTHFTPNHSIVTIFLILYLCYVGLRLLRFHATLIRGCYLFLRMLFPVVSVKLVRCVKCLTTSCTSKMRVHCTVMMFQFGGGIERCAALAASKLIGDHFIYSFH